MRSDSPKTDSPKARIYVLTGPVHCGKTSFLDKAVAVWKSLGYRIGGFLCPARWENGSLIGYDLLDLTEGGSSSFLRKGEGSALRQKSGPYVFLPEGLKKARNILLRDRDKDLLIVDEIGPLELKGGGLWPSVGRAIAADARCFCVVRQGILAEFRAKIKGMEVSVFGCGGPEAFTSMTTSIFGAAAGDPAVRKGSRL